jgi:Zn-dependent protease with chaperone function
MPVHALAAASPLLAAAVMAVVGARQRSQTGTGPGRWLAVSLGLGLIASLPAGAWLLLEATGEPFPFAGGVAAWTFSVLMCSRMVVPLRLGGRGDLPPVAATGPVVERVGKVARRMGLPPPPVRLVGTLGQLQAFAVTVSPLRPSLLIGDGILQRLKPSEVEAVLGHELAHVANGSLWFLSAAFSAAAAMALLFLGLSEASGLEHAPWLVAFGCWGMLGPLYAAISRPNERWCDLRAARTVGFGSMSGAVDKIHTTLPFPLSGWRSLLVHAVATHPSRAARLAHLRRHAPADERGSLPEDDRSVALHHAAGWAAAIVSLGCGALSFHLLRRGAVAAGLAVLVLPGVLQLGILLAVFLPARLAARRRLTFRVRGRRLFWGGLLATVAGAVSGVVLPPIIDQVVDPRLRRLLAEVALWSGVSLVLGGLLMLLVGAVLIARNRRFPGQVVGRLAQGDFLGARSLVASRRRPDPGLRYVGAIAAVAAGQRALGINELETLVAEKRPPPAALLTLSGLVRMSDPRRSLDLARAAVRRLPADTAARLSVAWATYALGRPEEADAEAAGVERAPGQVGAIALALRTRLALERGDADRARALLAAGSTTAPGEPLLLIVQAQLLAHTGPAAEALRARREAEEAVRTNPLLFLEDELAALPPLPAEP